MKSKHKLIETYIRSLTKTNLSPSFQLRAEAYKKLKEANNEEVIEVEHYLREGWHNPNLNGILSKAIDQTMCRLWFQEPSLELAKIISEYYYLKEERPIAKHSTWKTEVWILSHGGFSALIPKDNWSVTRAFKSLVDKGLTPSLNISLETYKDFLKEDPRHFWGLHTFYRFNFIPQLQELAKLVSEYSYRLGETWSVPEDVNQLTKGYVQEWIRGVLSKIPLTSCEVDADKCKDSDLYVEKYKWWDTYTNCDISELELVDNPEDPLGEDIHKFSLISGQYEPLDFPTYEQTVREIDSLKRKYPNSYT